MNLFYCNGTISIITASALIKEKFEGQTNILIIERDITRVIPDSFTSHSDEYEKIITLISKTSIWDEILEVECKNIYISLIKLKWLSKLPLNQIRLVFKKKKALGSISHILKSITSNDHLIVSDNSILWRYFYRNQCVLSFIEHGAASYRDGGVKKNWKYVLKGMYSFFTNLNLNISADSIFLSDNFKSNKVKFYKEDNSSIKPISSNLNKEIKEIFKNFFYILENEYPQAFDELLSIREKYSNKLIYIYLPTGIVKSSEYLQYLKSQKVNIKNDNAVFLIKPHPNDCSRDYQTYFDDLQLNSFSFGVSLNKYIPVELLLFFFIESKIFSSYSSSHLYSNWWLSKTTIFAEVEDSSIQSILITEYNAVYEDIQGLASRI
jgi:hypothetical protein